MSERLPTARGAAGGARLCRALVKSAWSIHVHGAEHVPASGPVILAPNHLGFIDGPLLFGVAPRPVHTLAKHEMFRGPVGWVLRAVGQIPVDRDQPDRTVLRAVLGVLEAGRVVAVYPEGTRGAGDFSELRPGLAWFALRSGAPVVPVVFLGSGARGRTLGSMPRLRARLDVVFGPPVQVQAGRRRSRAALDAASDQLRAALVAHHADTHRQLGGRVA
ncbi:MAG TPA: lysophospholipid acyltransferase family protein [Jiangellaceae bacterium]|nr:lysophospholipid acyltransferase family protein [Jiangellaceae bacterium]